MLFFPDWRQEDETTISSLKHCQAEMIYSNKFFGIQRNGGQQPDNNQISNIWSSWIINLKQNSAVNVVFTWEKASKGWLWDDYGYGTI